MVALEPGTNPEAWEVKKNYYLRNYDADASNLEEVFESFERSLLDFKAFMMAAGSSTDRSIYFEALKKVFKAPVHLSPYSFIAKECPYVLPAIAIGVEANMMSIRTGTDVFEGVDFLNLNGDEEEVIIAPPLTGPSPERIQEISDHLKQYSGVGLPKGNVYTVLTFVFDRMNIPIKVQPNKPVTLNLRQFSDNLASRFAGMSDEDLRAMPPSSYYDMTSYLDPYEWYRSSAARLMNGLFPFFALTRMKPLKCEPVPPRDVACPEVGREICNYFTRSGEPTYPSWLKDILPKGEEEGGDDGAPKKPGDDLLADSNDEQTPAPNPTADPVISSSPNAKSPCAEAGEAEGPSCPPSADAQAKRPNYEPSSLEESTVRECNATEAQIEGQESPSAVRKSDNASDEERFAAFKEKIDSELEALRTTVAALGAELESLRISERQRSAEAGPQTSAHGEGGAPDADGTLTQRSTQPIDGRIGGSEGSDVAGDKSALLYDMCRALLDDRQKWHEAHRTPSGNQ